MNIITFLGYDEWCILYKIGYRTKNKREKYIEYIKSEIEKKGLIDVEYYNISNI
jgi:hypothetical protein